MLRFARALALPLALLLAAAPALAADNWQAKDGNGILFTFRSKDTGNGQANFQVMADGTGTPYSSTNPLAALLNAGTAHIGSVNIDQIGGSALTLGQKASAASIPVVLPSDGTQASAANQTSQITQETATATALGTPADTPFAGSGSASNVGVLKGIYAQLSAILTQQTNETTANGTQADTAYTGTGSASEIAALKGLYAQIGLLLTQQTSETAANGTTADPAYTGTGTASEIAALKGLYVQVGNLIAVNGTSADTAYTGTGNASQVAALKGVFAALQTLNTTIQNTAVASGLLGTAPASGANIGYVQVPAGAAPISVDTVVHSTAVSRSIILPVQEASDTIAAGGTGAVTGDVLTIVGGTLTPANSGLSIPAGTAAKCTVTASSGAVTACVPLAGSLGSYTVLPTNPVATTSSGAGTGATLNVFYTGQAVTIAPANATRRGLQIQPQGSDAFLNGLTVATADQNSLRIYSGASYESSTVHVGTGALSMITAGSAPLPLFAREF